MQDYITSLAQTIATVRHKGLIKYHANAKHAEGNALEKYRIVCIGDSITRGLGSNPDGISVDLDKKSWPSIMANGLNLELQNSCIAHSFWGNGLLSDNITEDINSSDSRVTFSGAWAPYKSTFSGGGFAITTVESKHARADFIFQPSNIDEHCETDSLNLYLLNYKGNTPNIQSLDDQPVALLEKNVFRNITQLRFIRKASSKSGWRVSSLRNQPFSPLIIAGIEIYNSGVKYIQIDNMGASGSILGDWTQKISIFAEIAKILNPNLILICLTVNDAARRTPKDVYEENFRQLIRSIPPEADIIALSGVPVNEESASDSYHRSIIDAAISVAVENNITFLDFRARWVSQKYQPERNYYFDGVHPSKWGHRDIGNFLSNYINYYIFHNF